MTEAHGGEPPAFLTTILRERNISFREYVELCLYDDADGYYTGGAAARSRHADYITAPAISPVFGWALGRLARELADRMTRAPVAVVDIGCGDGTLIRSIADSCGEGPVYVGIDRSLSFVSPALRDAGDIAFATSLDAIPRDMVALVLSNELFDAIPASRVVRRDDGLHELGVTLANGRLDWCELPAPPALVDYFSSRALELRVGQFADVTPEWGSAYRDICERIERGLVVTFDYGFPTKQLFDPRIRMYGTAAAYRGHEVHRDLFASPGQQDLTAHVNFDDLERSGIEAGFATLEFTRQARFLLSIGITDHPLFAPVEERNFGAALAKQVERENARRLVLPDGIGDEIRVLVQGKGVPEGEWSFQRSRV
ncbi:MAG: class I SAM-dependent methyltransferase [Thermoanaerobaculia bacterium]